MKLRIVSLAVLGLALMVAPAWAQVLYENGPINGTTDAWTINFGYVVSDSFTLTSDATITSLEFGMWLLPGDVLESVEVSVTSQENPAASCCSVRGFLAWLEYCAASCSDLGAALSQAGVSRSGLVLSGKVCEPIWLC